jgi:hypothetical protein
MAEKQVFLSHPFLKVKRGKKGKRLSANKLEATSPVLKESGSV